MFNSMGGDRYITPEYLAPLPQKDGSSEKSPLQLLAQTCSQIGADPSPMSIDKGRKSTGSSSQGADSEYKPVSKSKSPVILVSDSKPVSFKPYESTKDGAETKKDSDWSSSASNEIKVVSHGQKSMSPNYHGTTKHISDIASHASDMSRNGSTKQSPPRSSSETSPILSSGLEILANQPKDIPLGTYRPPGPGGIEFSNPALRLPFGGLPGYPQTTSVSGNVCRDPYCGDSNCPTAIYSAYITRLTAASRGLPPGYLELMEAQKMTAMGLGCPPSSSIPTSLPGSGPYNSVGPHICNWMNGKMYCGKRFTSAEELLIHLKTHTNLSASDSALLNSSYASLLGTPGAAALLGRPGGSMGPLLPSHLSLADNRFSPYQRPGAPIPPSLAGLGATRMQSPFAGLPPSLSNYPASLYALYGARL